MKLRYFSANILLLLLLLPSFIIPQAVKDPKDVLPKSIDGWNAGADRYFNNENLYDYIDGGAELFLSFGFSKVFNRIYTNDKTSEIIVDIFYMNKPEDAFGAFLFTSGKVDSSFGHQSQVFPGAVIFWKMNYYISITSNNVNEEGDKIIKQIASLLDNAITGKGMLPSIIKYLPSEGLDKESIRYFRHYVWLNTHFYLSNDDILNINQNTETVTAKYGTGESKAVLILIQYPDEEYAKTAFAKFKMEFYEKYISSKEYKTGGRSSAAGISGKFIIAVFNGVSELETTNLLSTVIDQIGTDTKK